MPAPADSQPLTADELADIGARMIRLIEDRLQGHYTHLEHALITLQALEPTGAETVSVDLSAVDNALASIRHAQDRLDARHERLEQSVAELLAAQRWTQVDDGGATAAPVDLGPIERALSELQMQLASLAMPRQAGTGDGGAREGELRTLRPSAVTLCASAEQERPAYPSIESIESAPTLPKKGLSLR